MKLRVAVTLGALGVAVLSLGAEPAGARLLPQSVLAQKKVSAKPAARPGAIPKNIQLAPRGLRWGQSNEAIARLYEKVFDKEFLPLYKKVEPGPRMKALDAELADKKQLLRRSRVVFGTTPTGIDQSALKGEYSYNNGESMTRVTLRSGTTRHFFFFDDKLWKIYDEHRLEKGGSLGENFDEAIKHLTKRFGALPKRVAADYKGVPFDEARWQDSDKLIRAVDRGNVIGLVYADLKVQNNLASRRKNKLDDSLSMDKDVASALRKDEPPPAAKPEKKTK